MNLLVMPFDLAGQAARIGASIGVAVRADGDMSAAHLMQEADVAMYEAKRASKGDVPIEPSG